MQIQLKIIGGSHDGRKVAIKSSRFLIGRSKDCHLRPGGESIGDHHCAILSKEGLVVLQLLKNKSEVLVNDKPVEKKRKLVSGDRLKIGSLCFEMLIDSGKPVSTKPAPAKAATENHPPEKPTPSPASSSSSSSSIDDDISQWLEEADELNEKQKKTDPDSREFIPSELPAEASSSATQEEEDAAIESEENSAKGKKKKDKADKKEPGKLPPQSVEKTKDSGEAATQTLRKLFNRST